MNQTNNTMQIEIKHDAVFKDGSQIGTVEGDTVTLAQPAGPPVKAAIKRALGVDKVTFKLAGQVPAPEPSPEIAEQLPPPASATSAPMSDAELLAEMERRGLLPKAAPASVPVVKPRPSQAAPAGNAADVRYVNKSAVFQRMEQAVLRGEIPPPPAKNPAMGEKDPAFVAWFRDYATPEEYNAIYPPERRLPKSTRDFERGEVERRKIATEGRDEE